MISYLFVSILIGSVVQPINHYEVNVKGKKDKIFDYIYKFGNSITRSLIYLHHMLYHDRKDVISERM